MKQKDIIKMTTDTLNCDVHVIASVIDAFIDNLIIALQTEERVEIRSDFGSFVVRKKGGNHSLQPRAISKEQLIVSFKATPTFKKHINIVQSENGNLHNEFVSKNS